jgi:ribosomal protein S21
MSVTLAAEVQQYGDHFRRRCFPPKSPTVYPEPGEAIEYAVKRWHRGCVAANILNEIRRHEFHMTRSERRRAKSHAARRRHS